MLAQSLRSMARSNICAYEHALGSNDILKRDSVGIENKRES